MPYTPTPQPTPSDNGIVIRAFGYSDQGRFRSTNEDCFAIDHDLGLLVVADGMGGHSAGDVAARITVDTIVDAVSDRCGTTPAVPSDADVLRSAIQRAGERIRDAVLVDRNRAGMGTTIVAARVDGDRLSVASAGDSRVYVLSDGNLRQLTKDDSWLAGVLAEDGDADRFALQHHPLRHAVTNAVGAAAKTIVHVVETTVVPGDRLLLTTDGVHDVMDEWRLEQLLLEDDDPRTIAENVVRSALNRGSQDNCTAVVAAITVCYST